MKNSFLLILFIMFTIVLGCKQFEASEKEKDFFVRPTDFEKFGYAIPNYEKFEKFRKEPNSDGSSQIEYEFSTPDEEKDKMLFLSEKVVIFGNDKEAKESKISENSLVNFGMKVGGVSEEEVKDFYQYEKDGRYFLLKKDGVAIGSRFKCRITRKTFDMVILGFTFKNADMLKNLVEPRLKNIKEFSDY